MNEEDLKIREKKINSLDEKQKIEAERLVKKDEHLIQVAKQLTIREKELDIRQEEQNRKDIDLKARAKTKRA